ncbi:MAG: HU family DNA-binding protein [Desulfobacteraceae bacterium]
MTLNKSHLVDRVREDVRFKPRHRSRQLFLFPELNCTFLSKRRSAQIVDTLLEKIKAALIQGEDVRIARFGTFQVQFRWAKKGRNPRTGETLIIKSRRIVRFRVSPRLREKINSPPS